MQEIVFFVSIRVGIGMIDSKLKDVLFYLNLRVALLKNVKYKLFLELQKFQNKNLDF